MQSFDSEEGQHEHKQLQVWNTIGRIGNARPPGGEGTRASRWRTSLGRHNGERRSRRGKTGDVSQGTQQFDQTYVSNTMKTWDLFSTCAEDALSELASHVKVMTVAPGVTLVERGNPGFAMVGIFDGEVDVIIGDLTVAEITDGGYVGEALMLDLEQHWSVTLRTATACTMAEITNEDLSSACKAAPGMLKWKQDISMLKSGYEEGTSLRSVCRLFSLFSEKLLCTLGTYPLTRLYFPGQRIIENTASSDTYILARGRVTVETLGHYANVSSVTAADYPICFGELGLFATQLAYGATLTAQSLCVVRVLFRAVVRCALQQHSETANMQEVEELLRPCREASAVEWVRGTMKNAGKFNEIGFSEAFLDFLADNLQPSIVLQNHTIIDEAAPEQCFYFLSAGSVSVLKGGQHIETLESGAVVGEVVLFGTVLHWKPMAVTVVANETCRLEVLSHGVMSRALEIFPEDRDSLLLAAYRNAGARLPQDLRESGSLDAWLARHRTHTFAMIKQAPFFQDSSDDFMGRLSSAWTERIYLPDELVTIEGTPGDSMFIVAWGTAAVFKGSGEQFNPLNVSVSTMRKVAQFGTGSVFGELAMLGLLSARGATIKADTLCCMWEVSRAAAQELLDDFPEAQNKFIPMVSEHLQHTVPLRIIYLPLFNDFEKQFKMVLALKCQCRVYFKGQTIAKANQPGDGLYIINVGEAVLIKKNIRMGKCLPGDYFGSTLMLGIHRTCIADLEALEVCHVIIIERESFMRALQRHPSDEAVHVLVQSEAAKTAELLESMDMRIQRNVVVRNLKELFASVVHDRNASDVHDLNCLEHVFHAWSHHSRIQSKGREKQRQAAKSRDRIERWVQRTHLEKEERMKQEDLTAAARTLRETSRGQNFKSAWDGSPKLPQLSTSSSNFTPLSPYFKGPRAKSSSPRDVSRAPSVQPCSARVVTRRRFDLSFLPPL